MLLGHCLLLEATVLIESLFSMKKFVCGYVKIKATAPLINVPQCGAAGSKFSA